MQVTTNIPNTEYNPLTKLNHRVRREKRINDRRNFVDNLKSEKKKDLQVNNMGSNIRVPLSLIFDARLTPTEKQIYLILYTIGKERIGNSDDQSLIAFPSMNRLSHITRLSTTQVRHTIKRLEELELIQRMYYANDTNTYLVNSYESIYPDEIREKLKNPVFVVKYRADDELEESCLGDYIDQFYDEKISNKDQKKFENEDFYKRNNKNLTRLKTIISIRKKKVVCPQENRCQNINSGELLNSMGKTKKLSNFDKDSRVAEENQDFSFLDSQERVNENSSLEANHSALLNDERRASLFENPPTPLDAPLPKSKSLSEATERAKNKTQLAHEQRLAKKKNPGPQSFFEAQKKPEAPKPLKDTNSVYQRIYGHYMALLNIHFKEHECPPLNASKIGQMKNMIIKNFRTEDEMKNLMSFCFENWEEIKKQNFSYKKYPYPEFFVFVTSNLFENLMAIKTVLKKSSENKIDSPSKTMGLMVIKKLEDL